MQWRGAELFREHRRRHVQRGVNTSVVVGPHCPIYFSDEFSIRLEAVRVAQVHLELVVEGFLVAVLPRGAGPRAGYFNAELFEYRDERLGFIFPAVVGVEYLRRREPGLAWCRATGIALLPVERSTETLGALTAVSSKTPVPKSKTASEENQWQPLTKK